MLSRSEFLSLIEKYFESRGYVTFLSEEYKDLLNNFFDLMFRGKNNEIIAIKIVEQKEFSLKMKEEIEKIIVRILSIVSNIDINKVYIVAVNPRFTSLPNIDIFKESGIGLITIGPNNQIIERIPAKMREYRNMVGKSIEKDIYFLVKDLRTKVYLLEERMSKYEERLNNLLRRIEFIENKVSYISTKEVSAISDVEEKKKVMEDSFDFLRDNPWLNVLSKRKKST